MNNTDKHIYEFGAFRLDAAERLLLRAGEVVPLTPKSFEVLLALVRQPGHLLEKETLLNTVWHDSFVEENNLADNIFKLRKALGEGENGPRYIETVPRRGYRFVAEVREVLDKQAERAAITAPDEQAAAPPESRSLQKASGRLIKSVGLAFIGLLAVSAAVWFYLQRQPALTEKDTILLADFENKTGEEVFDGTLRQGLAIQLQQTPFLNVFPDERVRQTLRLMQRPPESRVTAALAREICQRERLKAFIAGSIAPLGAHYVITLEALGAESGETLARQQVEAAGKEQALRALAQAVTQLRQELGESLSSIQRFSKVPEQATTADLQAFSAWSRGLEHAYHGRIHEARLLFQRAVELDPSFAFGWSQMSANYWRTGRLELAAATARKAYQLRLRASEFEQSRITFRYHLYATGDVQQASDTVALHKQLFPRDWGGFASITSIYNHTGRYEQAVTEARQGISLNPNFAPVQRNLAFSLLRLNRFGEARELIAQARQLQMDAPDFHEVLYQIAFATGDAAGMQQQIDWARGTPDEYLALSWQTGAAAFAGQWRKAQDFARRALELTARGDTQEIAARYATEQALRGAVFGLCQQAEADAAQGLQLVRGRASLPRAALAFALCGEVKQAQLLVDELTKLYPQDTLLNELWLHVPPAALELQRGQAAQAVAQLETTERYEAAAEFWPQYLRGQAYLKLGRGAEAAAEFHKILAHRGYAPFSPLYPLAHLGLARAVALTGDTTQSRKVYEDFFALWKEADADLPVLREAKKGFN
jgi:eukaryotic-like serine/threonine-protein kinase